MFLGDTCVALWHVPAYVSCFTLLAVSICFYFSSCHNRAFFQIFAIVFLNLLGTGSRAPWVPKPADVHGPHVKCRIKHGAYALPPVDVKSCLVVYILNAMQMLCKVVAFYIVRERRWRMLV